MCYPWLSHAILKLRPKDTVLQSICFIDFKKGNKLKSVLFLTCCFGFGLFNLKQVYACSEFVTLAKFNENREIFSKSPLLSTISEEEGFPSHRIAIAGYLESSRRLVIGLGGYVSNKHDEIISKSTWESFVKCFGEHITLFYGGEIELFKKGKHFQIKGINETSSTFISNINLLRRYKDKDTVGTTNYDRTIMLSGSGGMSQTLLSTLKAIETPEESPIIAANKSLAFKFPGKRGVVDPTTENIHLKEIEFNYRHHFMHDFDQILLLVKLFGSREGVMILQSVIEFLFFETYTRENIDEKVEFLKEELKKKGRTLKDLETVLEFYKKIHPKKDEILSLSPDPKVIKAFWDQHKPDQETNFALKELNSYKILSKEALNTIEELSTGVVYIDAMDPLINQEFNDFVRVLFQNVYSFIPKGLLLFHRYALEEGVNEEILWPVKDFICYLDSRKINHKDFLAKMEDVNEIVKGSENSWHMDQIMFIELPVKVR